MAKGTSWDENTLIAKGYTPDGKGGWNPPPMKSKFIQGLKNKESEPVIEREVIRPTPDFEYVPKLEWFIQGYQVPSKKNSRISMLRGKKIITIPSNKYREYVTATKMQWEVFGREFKRTIEILGLQYPLDVEMTFIRTTKQRVDYFGPGESVFDLMTDFKWWPDDNRFYGKPFFGDMIVDKQNPGVKIKIITK